MKCRAIILITLACIFSLITTAEAVSTNLSPNAGFESNSTEEGTFQYANDESFSVANWIFVNETGIANNSPAWGGEANRGTVAFLQNVSSAMPNLPSISQVITSNASNFMISFDLANRGIYDIGVIDVYWDNQLIAQNLRPDEINFTSYSFNAIGLPGLTHKLTFRGVSKENDATVFIDNVKIEEGSLPDEPEKLQVCSCTGSTCGSNAIGGDQGDIYTGVSALDVQQNFITNLNTGWTCVVPALVRGSAGPKACFCEGVCGAGGIGADPNFFDLGLSEATVASSYGGGTPGNSTGWLCGNYRNDRSNWPF